MKGSICPNIHQCRLVNYPLYPLGRKAIEEYMNEYCKNDQQYLRCRRYQVKVEMGFCPDFVLPDNTDDNATIILRFDEEELEK